LTYDSAAVRLVLDDANFPVATGVCAHAPSVAATMAIATR
jgi:hypothetical protein